MRRKTKVEVSFNQKDLNGLRAAISRNPDAVRREVGKFLTKGIAIYNQGIIRNPWRIGASGGGTPVKTGNLRDTHRREIGAFEAKIIPTASYAPYVHGIEGFPRKRTYQLRPWLDWVKQDKDKEIRQLEGVLLNSIISDLAR